jgi:hypothetical protein
MAIAFDAASAINSTTGSSLTYAHTCTGNDRILFVGYHSDTASDLVTGITYGGVSMTKIGSSVQVPGDRYIGLYYLLTPNTGSNNVIITASGSGSLRSKAISYTGAAQSGQPDASGTNTASSATSLSKSITTIADNCWTIFYTKSGGSGTYSAGSGTTLINSSDAGGHIVAHSNGVVTPPGSTSLTINNTGAMNWAGIIASFSPAGTTFIAKVTII